MNRKVLVSIHDVWPGNQSQVERDLEWLRGRGVKSVALMVVPFYHGKRSLDQEPAFQTWLKEKQNQGAEIFMHGYRHLMPEAFGESAQRTWFGKWVNRRVQREAEFAGLATEQAKYLLGNACQIFSLCGITPVGFTLPTWWGKLPTGFKWPEPCRFFDGRFYVWDRVKAKCLWAPVLTFRVDASSKPLAHGGRVWTAFLHGTPGIRVVLHPGDLDHERLCRMVEGALNGREAMSYENFRV